MAFLDETVARMAAVQLMTDEELQAIPQAYEDGEAGFGALKSERGLFPLRSVKVAAKVSSLSGHITLEQTFLNAFDSPLEATYVFPLPSRAAVTSFRLEVKDRVVEGVIKERGEARREYTQAIEQGHRAAIAEEERSGVFTIRVGNIGAGEVAAVRLTMAAPLPFADGEATFRFPLLVAPRYIPGVKLGGTNVGGGTAADTDMTPEASRISPPTMVTLPGFPDPVQLSIEIEFDSASLPMTNVRSSLHTVMLTDVKADGQQDATSPSVANLRLRLNPEGDRRLDRDFILRFNITTPSLMTASLVLSDDQGGESQEGTWQLTLIAPQGGANGGATTPRDVAFVLDRSGSMRGPPRSSDSFARFPLGVRIFTLGIDRSVNEGFLSHFAALSPGGACELVESQSRLENAMDRIHRLIATPALIDVQIDGPRGPGIEPILDATSPAKLGAVFTGIPAIVSGRYRRTPAQGLGAAAGGGGRFVTVSAKTAAGENWNEAVPARQTLNPALGALWARALIRELDDRYTIAVAPGYTGHGALAPNPDNTDELRARILALSLRFSVLSRFSAFVAVDRAEKLGSDGAPSMQITQPAEALGGWRFAGAAARGGSPGSHKCAALARRRVGGMVARPQGGSRLKGLGPRSFSMRTAQCARKGTGCEESAPTEAIESITRCRAKKAKKIGAAPGASAKPANPGDQRAAAAACLATVRALQSPGRAADGDLLKKLVEGLKEVLARVMERRQTAASFDVVRKAVKAVEAGGGVDRALLGQLQAALERIMGSR